MNNTDCSLVGYIRRLTCFFVFFFPAEVVFNMNCLTNVQKDINAPKNNNYFSIKSAARAETSLTLQLKTEQYFKGNLQNDSLKVS